jgi:predicted RNA-binding Zn ribbon-like protein
MLFAHDTEVALAGTAALINTLPEIDGQDQLADLDALDRFVQEWGWTGSRTHDARELHDVQALRHELLELWLEPDDEQVVGRLNHLLRDAGALPQLVRHDEWDWHLHATDPSAPLAVRMAVETAMAFVDLVRTGELGRREVCGADACDGVYIDLSRNRSRRYCSVTCGNRMAVAAYRARKAAP